MPDPGLAFYVIAAVIVASAIAVVTCRNPISAALALVATLLSVGALFLSLRAEFLFATQVLVYTGGVMVLFVFVIMLVNVDDLQQIRARVRGWWLFAASTVFVFAALVYQAYGAGPAATPGALDALPKANTQAVAELLFVRYLLPFEIVSVLLLVAMVGAIVLSKKEI